MTNSIQFFTLKNNIGYIGTNFQKHFMDMEFEIPEKLKLKTKILKKNMTDKEILEEFKPKESNLGELAYAMENDVMDKNNYNANIFYIRDKDNVLWAVSAYWNSDRRYWYVNAYSVVYPNGWDAGSQVVSSDWEFEPVEGKDSLNLRTYESLEKRVKAIKECCEECASIHLTPLFGFHCEKYYCRCHKKTKECIVCELIKHGHHTCNGNWKDKKKEKEKSRDEGYEFGVSAGEKLEKQACQYAIQKVLDCMPKEKEHTSQFTNPFIPGEFSGKGTLKPASLYEDGYNKALAEWRERIEKLVNN